MIALQPPFLAMVMWIVFQEGVPVPTEAMVLCWHCLVSGLECLHRFES